METLFLGHEVIRLATVPSTNSYIKDLIKTRDLGEGFMVVTDYQTSGRGQIGNTWYSERGKNLLFSCFLRPHWLAADQLFTLNMSVCLALVNALNAFMPGFSIKWPNDILYDKRKIAGVLIENSLVGSGIEHSIVGVGLNVNQTIFEYPLNATSLYKLSGIEQDLELLLRNVLAQLERQYEKVRLDPKSVMPDYYSHLYGYNKWVRVQEKNKVHQIRIQGVDPFGHLMAETKDGMRHYGLKELKFLLD